MKMSETLLGPLKICCYGYKHPQEAMDEAEGFFFAKFYLSMKGYLWAESKFEFMKRISKKVILL